ncbi:FAS1-like dehydratase domain-containing protein [Paraburkholderia unamae]|uniref:3-methylfumaryl-CoA hydratase n=1 Tax=Paraburkholderia unamae TaxID=219649 RepID=A0ABX5KDX6_9BURK|nr:MaoC family dehydratase N-terminal domain-containing protein [Paraburkholderia unamae]PVX72795.1 3-methylfumaryl-CoA hydratase [Paraburkholderia unamae]RAR54260.1 3-methylfumaryl-CoA hydratase [Paraburkholderia unamae]CAG9272486.1 Mesaconyl-C(4)-CoA hydratase [Paraburkholderia unamae]
MSQVDIATLREWVGKTVVDEDVLSVRHAHLMAATIGQDASALTAGSPLPPLWHWLYFLEGLPPERLGRDGHPQRGGFLPPVPLPNRMWAGGRVRFIEALPLGGAVQKRSTILAVEHKQGRSGELVFVTVQHEILHDGVVAVSEEHDIVYKEASKGGPPRQEVRRERGEHREPFVATSTTLFRYSALTFNGHRIHYDQDYCREVEGYPNLVIHGPLNATLLAGLGQRLAGKPLRTFDYRGVQPATLGNALTLNATRAGDRLELWTALPDERVSMQASATC